MEPISTVIVFAKHQTRQNLQELQERLHPSILYNALSYSAWFYTRDKARCLLIVTSAGPSPYHDDKDPLLIQLLVPPLLLHGHRSAQLLHGCNDLLGLLLGHRLLHHLWRALDKLLGVDQTQPEQGLDLLDNLGLGTRVKLLQLECEERLLGRGGGRLFGLLSSGGGGRSWGRSEPANGEIGDVEARL